MSAPPIPDLCDDCAERWRAYQRTLYAVRKLDRGADVHWRVDAAPVGRHVDRLMRREGWTRRQIVDKSGVSKPTVVRVLRAYRRRNGWCCWNTTADALHDL